jgi:predicted component of type VI protein secretion system
MPKLIFIQHEFAAQSCVLPEGKTKVGRHPANNLVIRDDSVSSDHCEILVSWHEVILREHGSKNGTWVAGKRVTGQLPVNHGDMIRFGRVEARLELDQPQTEDATEHTTHLYRQYVTEKAPEPQPLHAVVQHVSSAGNATADDGNTLHLSAPITPGASPPAATPSQPIPSATTPPQRKAISMWVILGGAGLALASILWWLLGK